MPDYIVTGKKGAGKTLAMVGRMRDYIRAGKPVATNVDLNLGDMLREAPKAPVYRISDLPTIADLEAIGSVHETGNEERNGGLFLDECSAFLNARSWNQKGRDEVIVWLAHARKRGWDCFFMVQSLAMLDKQVRESFGEYIVTCRRLDRLSVPFIGRITKTLTFGLISGKFPQVHIAAVKYGSGPGSPHADTWTYRGRDLYRAYDTTQKIGASDCSVHSMLYPHRVPKERQARCAAVRLPPRDKLPLVQRIAITLSPDEAVRQVSRLTRRGLV